MAFFVYTLLVLMPIIYLYLTRNFNYWSKRNVKGPRPLPLFGNLLDILLKCRTHFELSNYQKYGNFYGYFMGNKPVLVVGDPELVKTILVKEFNAFPSRSASNQTEHPVRSQSLPNLEGDDWKRVRSITSPTFTSNKMKMMFPLMRKCIDDFMIHLDELANGARTINIKDMYGNLTLDVIASSAFATKLNSKNELESMFVKHARDAFRINPLKVMLLSLIPKFVFRLFGVKPERTATEGRDFYTGVAQRMVEMRRNGQKANDFLQLLIDADKDIKTKDDVNDANESESHHVNAGKEEQEVEQKVLNLKFNSSNKKLTENEIIAQAVSFLIAGYETTATTLTYATYELAINSAVQDKLVAEVNEVIKPNGDIDYETLSNLPYLDAIVQETLRHHAPVVKTARVCAQEFTIPNTNVTVYPGQQVEIPIYAIQHDERYYKDPFKFNPDRFMPENRANLVPYTYLPFGSGPRNCIGMRFSLLESKLALALIVRKYRFFRCAETDVPIEVDPTGLLSAPKRAIVGIEMRR